MLEKPNLDDDAIVAALADAYSIPATQVSFLPIGYDANAWIYRVNCLDEERYLLKVRQGKTYSASFEIPIYLNEIGVKQVVAPIRTDAGSLWTNVDRFTLILYPFIDGDNGAEASMTDSHWHEFGSVLSRIHATVLPPHLSAQVRRESFLPKWAEMVSRLQTKIKNGDYAGPHQEALASFWRDRSQEIGRIVGTAMELGRSLQARERPYVLCHADAHIYNMLIDRQSRFHIVDWDEIIMAPRERDLMFMLSSGTQEDADNSGANSFRRGYGAVDVDAATLAYYRYEWVVQEIGDFGERVFLTPDTGDLTQQDSVDGFIELFDPGDVVEEAYLAHLPIKDRRQ